MRMTAQLLLATVFVLAACGDESASVPRAAASVDTIDYRTTKGAAIQVAEVARVSGTAHDVNAVGRLRSMVVTPDGGVAFVEPSARRIVYFGPNGEPLGAFGREGGAPGEFRSIFGIGLIGDTVWAGDSREDRVTLIAPNRQLIRTFRLPKVKGQDSGNPNIDMKVTLGLQPDAFVGLVPSAGDQLFRANLAGNFLNLLPKSATDTRRIQVGTTTMWISLLPPRPRLDVSADGRMIVAYEHVMEGSNAPATSVALVHSTGDTAFVRTIRFEGDAFPQRLADSLIALRTKGWPTEHVRAYRTGVYIPPFHAPVKDVLIAEDHRVWLKLHTTGQQQDYLVLSPDGEILGTIVLPERTTVKAAKGNIAWTLQLNEFDVADVVKYKIAGF